MKTHLTKVLIAGLLAGALLGLPLLVDEQNRTATVTLSGSRTNKVDW